MITEATIKRGVRETARRAGISPAHMSGIANGTRAPGKALARRLRRMGVAVPKRARAAAGVVK